MSAFWYSALPLSAYGYSLAYANWEYYLSPRGFNVFNRQSIIQLDQRYNLIADGACAGIPDALCNGDGGLATTGDNLTPVGQLTNPRATATNPDFLKKGTLFTLPAASDSACA